MKANKAQLEKALKAPAEARFFLFYGPDDAGSRALLGRFRAAVGEGAERVDLTGAELKGDPARLADEAASLSLFGGSRMIIVDPVGDECLAAVEALLQAPQAGNPVALVAGALKPTSKLLKLALAHGEAVAVQSYPPEAKEFAALVGELARERGLSTRSDVARRVAESAGANRAIIAQELDKFALYMGASPEAPKPLDHDVIDAVGAAAGEGDLSRMVASVCGGDAASLQAELLRLRSEGVEGIALVRAVLRRMALLTRLRAAVEAGSSASAVVASEGKGIFWKEKEPIERELTRWRSDLLANSVGRLLEAERQVKASGSAGSVAVDEELFAICRQAARLR